MEFFFGEEKKQFKKSPVVGASETGSMQNIILSGMIIFTAK